MDSYQPTWNDLSRRTHQSYLCESNDYGDQIWVVIDFGDTSCQIGVAGEDAPHLVVPISSWKTEWANLVQFLSRENSLIYVGFTVPPFEIFRGPLIQSLLDFFFIQCGDTVGGVFILPRTLACLYSFGRTSGLIVTLGEREITVGAVMDGYEIGECARRVVNRAQRIPMASASIEDIDVFLDKSGLCQVMLDALLAAPMDCVTALSATIQLFLDSNVKHRKNHDALGKRAMQRLATMSARFRSGERPRKIDTRLDDPWIGLSIVGSLNSRRVMSFSKDDYMAYPDHVGVDTDTDHPQHTCRCCHHGLFQSLPTKNVGDVVRTQDCSYATIRSVHHHGTAPVTYDLVCCDGGKELCGVQDNAVFLPLNIERFLRPAYDGDWLAATWKSSYNLVKCLEFKNGGVLPDYLTHRIAEFLRDQIGLWPQPGVPFVFGSGISAGEYEKRQQRHLLETESQTGVGETKQQNVPQPVDRQEWEDNARRVMSTVQWKTFVRGFAQTHNTARGYTLMADGATC